MGRSKGTIGSPAVANAIYIISLLIPVITFGQATQSKEFDRALKKLNLHGKYEVNYALNPAYLQSDFNKDGVKDIAGLVIEKATKKRGIILIHIGENKHFVFGAGTRFGNGSDDFKWMKGWSLYNKNIAFETTFSKEGDITGGKKTSLVRPAIYIYNLEDGSPTAGGLIYWIGKKYIWIHQGE